METLGNLEGLSVLDVACGEGFYTRLVRHRGAARVTGVDLSEGMVALDFSGAPSYRPYGFETSVVGSWREECVK